MKQLTGDTNNINSTMKNMNTKNTNSSIDRKLDIKIYISMLVSIIYNKVYLNLMTSNEEQVKKLHERLNILETINPENNSKLKLTHFQELLKKIQTSFTE